MKYWYLTLLLHISTITAFRMNSQDKELQAFSRTHPLVRAELGDSEHGDPYKFDTPGMNNKTNSMNYEF
jgi:hypothetical protein